LPAGVFNPYAGVKTSILLLDKSFAKKTDKILFVKIEKDGYDLGAQRRALCNEIGDKPELCPKHSDLPDALNTLRNWHTAVLDGEPDSFVRTTASALLVYISKLAENGDYNLSADRYREVTRINHQTYPMVALGDERYFTIESGGTPDSKIEKYWNGDVYWATLVDLPADDHISIITDTQRKITEDGLKNSSAKIVPPDSVIVSSRATIGRVGINKVPLATNQGFKNIVIKDRNSVDTMFVALMAKKLAPEMETLASGGTFKEIAKTNFAKLQIPLPPLETQRQIVDEIAAHQRIIGGARQVVDGWKPNLELELAESLPEGVNEWEVVKLGDITELITKGTTPTTIGFKFEEEGINFVKIESITKDGRIIEEKLGHVSAECHEALKRSQLRTNDVLFSIAGALGRVVIIPDNVVPANTNQALSIIRLKDGINSSYVAYFLKSDMVIRELEKLKVGFAQYNISLAQVSNLQIPLPPLEIQREIVARIERERATVEGNCDLIRLYEEKVTKVIERVWEG
jgi:type I restriction enzyme M protein